MQFNYFPNVPNAPNDPADDQPQMQTNTLSIQNLIEVDHYGFNATFNSINDSGGFHTVVHFIPQNSAPTPIGTIGQLWTQQITFNGTTDEALFFRGGGNAANRITQITAPIQVNSSNNGYVFLPGGIIIQWGFVNGTHSGLQHTFDPGDTGSISFPITFPNAIFTVNANLNFNSISAGPPASGSAEIVAMDTNSITTSGCNYFIAGSGSSYTRFFWTAIGN